MYSQKVIGLISTILICTSYVYFTMWVMITPLIDKDEAIQAYFPHRKWAFIVPIYSCCVFLSLVLTFTGLALIYEKNSEDRVRNYKNHQMQMQGPPSTAMPSATPVAPTGSFGSYSMPRSGGQFTSPTMMANNLNQGMYPATTGPIAASTQSAGQHHLSGSAMAHGAFGSQALAGGQNYDQLLRNAQSGQGRAPAGAGHFASQGQHAAGGIAANTHRNRLGEALRGSDATSPEDAEYMLTGRAVGEAVAGGVSTGASLGSHGLGGRSRRNFPIPRDNVLAYPSAALINQE